MLSRRAALRLGAASVSLAAVGGGAWYQSRRASGGLHSARITGPWPELGPGIQWILPDLHDAPMEVPDRPHDVEEARDPARRAAVHRVRGFTVTSSSRRLRADTAPDRPAPGVTRIAAVGDSITFGWGLPDAGTWPAKLQAELVRRGHAVEVLNAGVPAQRLEGMQAWLEKQAPALGVSAVLFTRRPYPTGGDPYDAYGRTVTAVRRALPNAKVLVLMPPVSQFDPHGSEVWQTEEAGVRSRIGDTPLFELTPVFRAAQGDKGCRLEVKDGTFTVVRGDTGERLASAPASPHGLPEEIYRLFEADPTVREALFFDDGHPDADGVEVLVPAVADRVEQAGWFG